MAKGSITDAELESKLKLEKSKVARLSGLLELLVELRGKETEILEEARRIVAGEPGTGARLRRLEQAFDAVWCHRYTPGESGRYVWRQTTDVPALKRLLRILPIDEIEGRMATYLLSDDPFYRKERHPFGLFVSGVNRFTAAALAAPDLQLSAPVVDCKHEPVCASDQEHTRRKIAESHGEPF